MAGERSRCTSGSAPPRLRRRHQRRPLRTVDPQQAVLGRDRQLGHARALCEAARVLTYRVIDQRAHGKPPSAESNVARVAGTVAEQAVADLALEIFGEESPAAEDFKEALPIVKQVVGALAELKGVSMHTRKEEGTMRTSLHIKAGN